MNAFLCKPFWTKAPGGLFSIIESQAAVKADHSGYFLLAVQHRESEWAQRLRLRTKVSPAWNKFELTGELSWMATVSLQGQTTQRGFCIELQGSLTHERVCFQGFESCLNASSSFSAQVFMDRSSNAQAVLHEMHDQRILDACCGYSPMVKSGNVNTST